MRGGRKSARFLRVVPPTVFSLEDASGRGWLLRLYSELGGRQCPLSHLRWQLLYFRIKVFQDKGKGEFYKMTPVGVGCLPGSFLVLLDMSLFSDDYRLFYRRVNGSKPQSDSKNLEFYIGVKDGGKRYAPAVVVGV